MIRRSLLIRFVAACTLCASRAVDLVISITAVPLMYLLKAVTSDPAFSLTGSFKLIAFRVIERLKPIYRHSYLTHGLSLGTRSTA